MKVRLSELRPNPLRDFQVDPVDPEIVERLRLSIDEMGFWGGVACRRNNGAIEICAGHHRIEAAKAAGIEEAEVFVAPRLGDVAMLRLYSTENGTQRGNQGTARTGTVAAAVRLIARAILRGDVSLITETSERGELTVEAQVQGKKGIGAPLVEAVLGPIQGINGQSIRQDLKNLKVSGAYARIIAEVRDELERERVEAERAAREAAARAARAAEEREQRTAEQELRRREQEAEAARTAAEKAGKAAAAAAEELPRFDYPGVARHLKNPHQLDVFRDMVLGDGLKDVLRMDDHEALAAALVEQAKRQGDPEMSAYFIRLSLYTAALELNKLAGRLTPEMDAEVKRQEWEASYADLVAWSVRSLSNVAKYAERLEAHMRGKPFDGTVRYSQDFFNSIAEAERGIDILKRRI